MKGKRIISKAIINLLFNYIKLPGEGRYESDPLAQLPIYHHIQFMVVLLNFTAHQYTTRFFNVGIVGKRYPRPAVIPE